MSAAVTSVHSRVTSSDPPTYMCYRDYRSQGIVDEMKATSEFFHQIDMHKNTHYGIDFEACCTGAWFVRENETQLVKIISHKCKLRWCPICSKNKGYRISKSVEEKLLPDIDIRLLTLTLKHNDSSLIVSSDRLYRCFRALRKTARFKKYVSGGIWFYQLVWSSETEVWHPHIHCVLTGKYFKQSEIKALWQKITGDSYVVDIRYANRRQKVIGYISRYVSRPVSLCSFPPIEHLNVYNAFHSRKLCGSWGKLRGVDLRGKSTREARKTIKVGSWSTVWSMSKVDGNALLILDRWKNQTPLPAGVTCIAYDNLIDGIAEIEPRAAPDPTLF